MARSLVFTALFLTALPAQGQIQVDLKFKRLQYIAFEPVIATVRITNMAGRDIFPAHRAIVWLHLIFAVLRCTL